MPLKPYSIIVVGHRNPNNDSISSAAAYAHLKNELDRRRSGDLDDSVPPHRCVPIPHAFLS